TGRRLTCCSVVTENVWPWTTAGPLKRSLAPGKVKKPTSAGAVRRIFSTSPPVVTNSMHTRLAGIDVAIVAVYLVGTILLGTLFARRQRDMRTYFAGDRNVTWWLVLF